MIRYHLRCPQGHEFDGWYPSSEGFERLVAAAQVACPICGATDIEKALMTPAVAAEGALQAPADTEAERALQALRDHVEANSDYVGTAFADQARAMHDGDIPERAIHGEARLDQARALLEDGIPVMPLPFRPKRQQN